MSNGCADDSLVFSKNDQCGVKIRNGWVYRHTSRPFRFLSFCCCCCCTFPFVILLSNWKWPLCFATKVSLHYRFVRCECGKYCVVSIKVYGLLNKMELCMRRHRLAFRLCAIRHPFSWSYPFSFAFLHAATNRENFFFIISYIFIFIYLCTFFSLSCCAFSSTHFFSNLWIKLYFTMDVVAVYWFDCGDDCVCLCVCVCVF